MRHRVSFCKEQWRKTVDDFFVMVNLVREVMERQYEKVFGKGVS